jgi:hypothetical protein
VVVDHERAREMHGIVCAQPVSLDAGQRPGADLILSKM